jgi:hypothetical protein
MPFFPASTGLAILRGTHRDIAPEYAPEVRCVLKPNGIADLRNANAWVRQQLDCSPDSRLQNEVHECRAADFFEHPAEMGVADVAILGDAT